MDEGNSFEMTLLGHGGCADYACAIKRVILSRFRDFKFYSPIYLCSKIIACAPPWPSQSFVQAHEFKGIV